MLRFPNVSVFEPPLGSGSPVEHSVLTGRAVPQPPVLDNGLRTGREVESDAIFEGVTGRPKSLFD